MQIPNDIATLAPMGYTATSWDVKDTGDDGIADGSTRNEVSSMETTAWRRGIFYAGHGIELGTPFGTFKGVVNSTSDTYDIGEGRPAKSATAESGMETFNVNRSIPPFNGKLNDWIHLLMKAVGYSDKVSVMWDPARSVNISGFYGNVFEKCSAMLATIGYEWVSVNDAIVVRPRNRLLLDESAFFSEPTISFQRNVSNRDIHVYWYDQQWGSDLSIYPALGIWSEDADTIENTDNIPLAAKTIDAQDVLSVEDRGAGFDAAVVEQSFDLSASLTAVNQPVCSLPPCFRRTFENNSSVVVHGYLNGWKMLGNEVAQVDKPSSLPQKASSGDFVLSRSNNVYYYCTIGWSSTTDSKGNVTVVNASWHEFGSWNGDTVSSSALYDAYVHDHANLDGTMGYYTVTGNDGYPMMPEQWTKNGGKLEVRVDRSTSKIVVRVTGPNIGVECPVLVTPPTEGGYKDGEEGDIVAYDPTGRLTASSLMYHWVVATSDTAGHWEYDQDGKPFPYSPYKIAIGTYNGEYPGLYITGDGIRWTAKRYDTTTSHLTDNDPDLQKGESQVEVNNIFCNSEAYAKEIADNVDHYNNGVSMSLTGTLRHVSDSMFARAMKGTFDWVTNALRPLVPGDGTFNEVNYALEALDSEGTFASVNETIKNLTSYSIADNEFGNIIGAILLVPGRGAFRVTSASNTVDGISVDGYECTTLGDLDEMIARTNPDMTLGDFDAIIDGIQQRWLGNEDYTLGDWSQEPLNVKGV